MIGRLRRRRHGDAGVVTAELALTLPLLVAVTLGLVWLLAVGLAQVRLVDAARETARAVARGEPVEEAVRLGARVAPQGASVGVTTTSDRVVATSEVEVRGPGGLFDFLPGVRLHAEATAAMEPGG